MDGKGASLKQILRQNKEHGETKSAKRYKYLLALLSCPRRIRTTTDRTKNCSATITP